jgi:spore coat protein H
MARGGEPVRELGRLVWVGLLGAVLGGCLLHVEGDEVRPPPHGSPPHPANPLPDGGSGPVGQVTEDGGVPGPVDPAATLDFELPPLQDSVQTFELEIPAQTLARFHADPYSPEQPAVFVHDGQRHEVLVRVRGGSSRYYPKKSWRVEFPEGTSFEGRRKLNLVAEMADRTMMIEKLAFDLLRAMGAPAPQAKFVRLVINGRYEGAYLDLERVDKSFTRARRFADKDPDIYRCGNHDCEFKPFGTWFPWQTDYTKETNEFEPWGALAALVDVVNAASEPEFEARLEDALDVESYLRSMVMDALMSNDIVMDSNSYLVRDRILDRWVYVPWDLNNSAARWWPTYGVTATPFINRPVPVYALFDTRIAYFHRLRGAAHAPGVYRPAFSNLTTRVYLNDSLRHRWVHLLERALDDLFTPATLHPRIDAMHALLTPLVEDDPYVQMTDDGTPDPDGLAKFRASRTYVRDYVTGRAQFLRQQLAGLREPFGGLVLGAFNPEEDWLEVRNDGPGPLSTAGLVVTLDLRNPFTPAGNVPAQVLAPGQSMRLTAGALGLDFPPQGTVGLFRARSVDAAMDALFYAPSPDGALHVRGENGWEIRAR